jgi:hypothetical protein
MLHVVHCLMSTPEAPVLFPRKPVLLNLDQPRVLDITP